MCTVSARPGWSRVRFSRDDELRVRLRRQLAARIKAEKTLIPDPQLKQTLWVAGANATPPDDCSGVYGYYDFVAAVSDPPHPGHAEMIEWIGRP